MFTYQGFYIWNDSKGLNWYVQIGYEVLYKASSLSQAKRWATLNKDKQQFQ